MAVSRNNINSFTTNFSIKFNFENGHVFVDICEAFTANKLLLSNYFLILVILLCLGTETRKQNESVDG